MKKYFLLSLLLAVSVLFFIRCNKSDYIYIYSPPDTSTVPLRPYTIKVSKYYDSLFANQPGNPNKVQDFDIGGNSIFVWAYFAFGLYEYNMENKTMSRILGSPSGDCIAADTWRDRVFWAWFGEPRVMVFDLNTSKVDDFLFKSVYMVAGMQVYEHKLYVLYQSDSDNPEDNVLDVYSRSGELLESISYPRKTRYLAINRGIVYSVAYDSVQMKQVLSRFELSSRQFLKDVENPSSDCSGIRSYGDYFFFTDWEKNMIGYVPLEEIERRGE